MKNIRYTLLLACGFLALGVVFFPKNSSPPPASNATAAAAPRPTSRPRKSPRPSPVLTEAAARELAPLPQPVSPPPNLERPETREWITAQCYELNRLSQIGDLSSVQKIAAELRNPFTEIREAALTAAIGTGNRAAVPYLQQLAAEMSDSGQQQALYEAIDQLRLPTPTEKLDEDAQGRRPRR